MEFPSFSRWSELGLFLFSFNISGLIEDFYMSEAKRSWRDTPLWMADSRKESQQQSLLGKVGWDKETTQPTSYWGNWLQIGSSIPKKAAKRHFPLGPWTPYLHETEALPLWAALKIRTMTSRLGVEDVNKFAGIYWLGFMIKGKFSHLSKVYMRQGLVWLRMYREQEKSCCKWPKYACSKLPNFYNQ